MQPNFIGIGMQRCASSWLHRVLDEHPRINKPPSGLHFFNNNYDRGDSWYIGELSRYLTDDSIIGEFSTTYSYPECAQIVAERLFSFNPNVKLIASIRRPMDRCYSDYRRSLRKGEIPDQSFTEAIAGNMMFVQRSLYAPIIAVYLKYFKREQFHFINYDNIVNDPGLVATNLYKFLDVNSDFQPSILQKRLGATYEMKSARFEVLINKFQKNGKYFLQSIRLDKIIPFVKGSGIVKLLRYINTASSKSASSKKTPQSHTVEIQTVHSQFNKDIEDTMILTGLDLQTWFVK